MIHFKVKSCLEHLLQLSLVSLIQDKDHESEQVLLF